MVHPFVTSSVMLLAIGRKFICLDLRYCVYVYLNMIKNSKVWRYILPLPCGPLEHPLPGWCGESRPREAQGAGLTIESAVSAFCHQPVGILVRGIDMLSCVLPRLVCVASMYLDCIQADRMSTIIIIIICHKNVIRYNTLLRMIII